MLNVCIGGVICLDYPIAMIQTWCAICS